MKIQMPSANQMMQSASPEMGFASGSMGNGASGRQSEVLKQVLCVIDKKVRNMEKKKIQKVVKKSARREQLLREEAEQRKLKTVLELQFLLDRLGDVNVRQDLKQGVGGSPLLTDKDLAAFDEFYKLVGPDRDQNIKLADQYEDASVHLWELLEGKDKAVVGTTYKALKESLDQVLLCGYFDRIPAHQNGVCEDEEDEEPTVPVATTEMSEAEEQTVDPGLFVNRQFIPDGTYSSSDTEQTDQWTRETEFSCFKFKQPPPPVALEPHPMDLTSPVPPSDPLVRKRVVQDLMEQMQGTYNFMQDSMLDFDGQPIDPAIVSAQPMKPSQNMDVSQMVCPPVHPDSQLSQSNSVPIQLETTQMPIVSPTPPPMYQTSHTPDPRPPTEPIDPTQTSMSLSTEPPPPSTALPAATQTQVFQTVSNTPHGSGINVNAAPFQSMQTVFNLNAPVPPANETEVLSQSSQYQNGYNQAFNSQPQHPVEQPEMQSEQLQSVVGAFHSQDQSGGHQQPPQQGQGFNRQTQSFYNSRGMARGGPRNARGLINGYRGSSNGFRGGYDGYRPPFTNSPNSGYGQTQFSTPRDYSNGNYQRDGYQQNYKRGASQGPRGVSRGNTQAMRS
uniref:Cell cycle associated protein 1b n=1 Tax=Gouania willdenowi TaxID=441366 RepID=A0A8C5EW67_GOUWI